MTEMEASIENLMDDEIMDQLLKADNVKRSDVWQVIGRARRALSDGGVLASRDSGADKHLSVFAEMSQIRHRSSNSGREVGKRGHV